MHTDSFPPSPTTSAAPLDSTPSGPPAPAPSPEPGREFPLRDVFVGPHGLYPGTRWLIYLAMGGMLALVLGSVVQALHHHSPGAIWWGMVSEGALMMAAILPGFVMARIEGRPFGAFGLPSRGAFGRDFWIGALWGIGFLTALMLMLRVAGVFSFGSLSLHGLRIAKFAAYYAFFFLAVGFFEEFMMRGYSQWVLSQGMRFWPAAALLSAGFGAIHSGNSGESKIGLIAAGLIGFFFCLTLRRTGMLWWAVGFHMAWDWGESFLYSVPDSGGMSPGHLLNSSFNGPEWLTGGSVGPEGSVLIFVILLALWLLFDQVYREVKYSS